MKLRGNAKVIPADPKAIFLPFQSRWIADRSRIKLCQKGRQLGFTWATAYDNVSQTALATATVDEWVSSRDDIQAQLFLEDCKFWAGNMQIAADDLGEQILDNDARHTAFTLRFDNGHKINSMSSNPNAQAGKRGGRTLDEFALHPDPRKLWSIAYPGITWGGSLKIISTHRGSHNFFNQLIREVKEKGNPKGISLHTVTLQDALDQGFLFKLQQALPEEDERIAMDEAAYFDFIRKGAADEESFQQEFMCKPADDDAAFLEYGLIGAAEYAEGIAWTVTEGGTLYAGIDIGRKNDLTVLWVVEKLGDVFYTRHVEALRNMPKGEQEKVLWPWVERVLASGGRVAQDYTGLGIGWGDDAQARFGKYRYENVSFTAQTKEALAYPVRGAMEDKRLRIPYDPAIRADLRSVTKSTTAAGNIRFTAERTPDGHADRFWALALAIHAASGESAAPWRPVQQFEQPSRPLNSSDKQALKYVLNTGQSVTIEQFDDDHEPIGPMLREVLVPKYMAPGADGQLKLTADGLRETEEHWIPA